MTLSKVLLLAALCLPAYSQLVVVTEIPVVSSATPAFVCNAASSNFTMTLTANVTFSSLSCPAITVGSFRLCQDSVGNRTMTWPIGATGFGLIDPIANHCSTQPWKYDGTLLRAIGAMGAENIPSPAGAVGAPGATGPSGGPQGATGTTGSAGPGYAATSSTTLTIGAGTQTVSTQAGLAFGVNSVVGLFSTANPANYMIGTVASYSGTTLAVTVPSAAGYIGGSGTFSAWTISVAGQPGVAGATGPTGTTGSGYYATSATTMTIGTGVQTFGTQAGLAYAANSVVGIYSTASSANFMIGTVVSYSGTTMAVSVPSTAGFTGGSGTFASWNISLAGQPGLNGTPGATGPTGTTALASIGLTMPGIFAVANSPLTSSGTLAVTTQSGQTSHQVYGTCGSATTFGPCSLGLTDLPNSLVNTGGSYTDPSWLSLTWGGGRITGIPTFLQAANNLSDLTNPGSARSNLGLGAAATQSLSAFLQPSNNLSDLTNTSTSLSNLFGTRAANLVWAGPATGSAANPSFRSLTLGDMPSGVLSSVGLTMPSWLSVGNSPLVANGTIGVTAATGQTSHQVIGTGAGASFAPLSLTLADLPGTVVNTGGSYTDPTWLSLTATGGRISGFGTAALQSTSAFEVPLSFTSPLLRTSNTISINMWGTGTRPVAASALGVSGNCVQWSAAGIGDTGTPCGSGGGGGANALGFYFVNQATNAPANAINLGAQSTGLMKLTISTGVATSSTAVAGTDYQAPITTGTVDQYINGTLGLTSWANCIGAGGVIQYSTSSHTPSCHTLAAADIAAAGALTNSTTGSAAAVGGITITGTPSVGQIPIATSGTAATWQSVAGTGTLTNVATTGPITGGPITTTGTIACPTCTTSAAALTSNAVVIGGGSQATATISADTNTTHALFATAGAPAFRALASGDIPNNAANTTGNAATATALAATPSQCSGGQFALGVTAAGAANCSTPAGGGNVTGPVSSTAGFVPTWGNTAGTLLSAGIQASTSPGASMIPLSTGGGTLAAGWIPTLNQSTTGNAATATALAALPTPCPAGQSPRGIIANGNSTGCAPFGTDWVNVTTIAGVDPTGVTDSAAGLQTWSTAHGSSAAILYFPAGSYYFNSATGPNGTEECVRFYGANISIVGDGGGRTIFTDSATPACTADIGWGNGATSNYTYETDTGYAVTASSAVIGAASVTLTTVGQASNFPVGQYVFLRGAVCSFCGGGQYYGELNQVAVAGNTSTGVVVLAWPLSQDFSQQTGIQLNVVASSEILKNFSVSGITVNHHSQALIMSQTLGLSIHDNIFNYLGSTAGQEMSQLNQNRQTLFYNNVVNIPGGIALDMERNPTDWKVYGNTLNGESGALAGEAGAKISIHDNTINCYGSTYLGCVSVDTSGNLIGHNQISLYYTGSGTAGAVLDYNGGAALSNNTVVDGNVIISGGSGAATAPAISLQSSTSTASNNQITAKYVGLSLNVVQGSGGMLASSNNVVVTTNGAFGCVLVQGSSSHAVTVDGLTCTSLPGAGVVAPAAVWIADNGAQTVGTQATLTNITGTNLTNGIKIVNNTHDNPNIGTVTWSGVGTNYPNYPGLAATGTSGAAYCTQLGQGVIKTTSCLLVGYAQTGSAQTFTYPTAYNVAPSIDIGNGSCGVYNATTSASVLTFPANAAMTAESCNITLIGQ